MVSPEFPDEPEICRIVGIPTDVHLVAASGKTETPAPLPQKSKTQRAASSWKVLLASPLGLTVVSVVLCGFVAFGLLEYEYHFLVPRSETGILSSPASPQLPATNPTVSTRPSRAIGSNDDGSIFDFGPAAGGVDTQAAKDFDDAARRFREHNKKLGDAAKRFEAGRGVRD